MEHLTATAEQWYASCVRAADDLLVCLDFDGVLAPIVDDPDRARVHPGAHAAVLDLVEHCRAVAVVTGRPARQVIDLGGLDELGRAVEERGRTLHLRGQYGNERWDSASGRVHSPRPPAGLARFEAELPALLRAHDAAEAHLEDKVLALGVHTRRLPDPDAALERLREPVAELAARHDLVVEPGRQVLEIRGDGSDKGAAVRELLERTGAGAVLFVGDDLGDVAAFEAVDRLRGSVARSGTPGLLVASESEAGSPAELVGLADLLVEGPDGVVDLLRTLAADAAGARL